MKAVRKLAVLFLVIFSTGVRGGTYTEPDGVRLRDIVAKKYPDGSVYIGGTTGWSDISCGMGAILNSEFSYVTPENDFKQTVIHPEPGVWNWRAADAWVRYCEKHGQVIRIHGPVSPQCSWWTKDDNRTAAELRKNLNEYVTALFKRYSHNKHVKWMDVVNETVLPDGSWHGPRPGNTSWENPWLKIGVDESSPLKPPLYVKLAFEIANKYADPSTELIINQHGSMEDVIWDKIKGLVVYLRAQGLRVDGIGWQAHVNTGWEKKKDNPARLTKLIEWAHANGLSFHITECNVWMKNGDTLQGQADTFAAILRVLLSKRGSGEVTWNTWGLSDAFGWRSERRGRLFDRDLKPKPAYYAIQNILLNPPPITK